MHVYFHLQNCEQIEITGPDKTPPEDSYESAFTLVFFNISDIGGCVLLNVLLVVEVGLS